MRQAAFCAVLAAICLAPLGAQSEPGERKAKQPAPTHADVRYGPHERNVLDLYLADSDKPTPLVVYIHGGGFRNGDKRSVSAGLIRRCHKAGISVAALNYPLTDTASFPVQMMDPARAIQLLRSRAREWNLDPARFGATGGSAGAGISLWIAFHDDMADPTSDDPVARESTRLQAVAVSGAQTSYDPRWIKKHIGGRAHEHPALALLWGLQPDEMDTPRAHRIFHDVSPISYLSADDPPVWAVYREPDEDLPPNAKPGQGIHHPRFGSELKKLMDALGVDCILKHAIDYPGGKLNVWPREGIDADMAAFFAAKL